MLTFERIILTMLAFGIWALVLTPPKLGAHHYFDGHSCNISGLAYGDGDIEAGGSVSVSIGQWYGVNVDCTHS